MTLIEGASVVATQSWSQRFNYVAAVSSALEALNALVEIFPVIEPILSPLLPPGWFAIIGLICVAGSIVSRLFKQPAMHEAIAEKATKA
jgi:hypothetical protein